MPTFIEVVLAAYGGSTLYTLYWLFLCHLYIYYVEKNQVYSFEYSVYLNVSMFPLLMFMFSFHVFPQHRISILKSWSQEVT